MIDSAKASTSISTCVIGGAGFIGRAVVNELLASGRQVIVLGRRPSLAQPLPPGVRYLANPEGREDVLISAIQGVSEVVDLAYATVPKTSFQDPVHDLLMNVPATVRLFEIAAECNLRKFVWASSGGTVYGRSDQSTQDELHPNSPISPYGITKLTLEKYARLFYEIKGLPVVCVRPANAYGEGQQPYGGQGFIATAMASILEQRELVLYGEEGTIRDYLHVSDMAKGILAALQDGQPGEIYNIGSGQGFSNRDILRLLEPLATAAGRPVRVQVLPERPFDVPANILNCEKLRSVSHWTPRLTLEQGLAQTWAWHKKRLLG